jgi:hypothetical protein
VRRYAVEQIVQAKGRLAMLSEQRGVIHDRFYFRIPEANLIPEIIRVLETAGPGQRPVACLSGTAPQSVPGNTTAAHLQGLLADVQAALHRTRIRLRSMIPLICSGSQCEAACRVMTWLAACPWDVS